MHAYSCRQSREKEKCEHSKQVYSHQEIYLSSPHFWASYQFIVSAPDSPCNALIRAGSPSSVSLLKWALCRALGRGRCGDIATGRGFHQLGLLCAVWGCAPAAYRLNPVCTACWLSVEEKRGEGEREVRKEEVKRKNVQEKIGVNHCNRKMD